MKLIRATLLYILATSLVNCSSAGESTTITAAKLQLKKTEIETYVGSVACSDNEGCDFMAFGAKPCGGPRSYLLFSNSIDKVKLQKMVTEYNEQEAAYNIQINAVSDCMYLLPPTEVKCINGICTVIK